MNPSIFKAYDIRGVVPEDLDAEAARAIGIGIARFLGAGRIAVGADMRESGRALRGALVAGLCGEGREVVDVGRLATPMLYFASTALDAAGGVMITASHNPGRYNGFKVCGARAIPVGIETGLAEIQGVAEQVLRAAPAPARGSVRRESVARDYVRSLLELFPARPRLRVVLDAGNGIAGEAIEGLLSALPLEVDRLYFEPDGSFPNHEADPLKPENLVDLQAAVGERRADLGVAFDGDGDRAVFVDERGAAVPADLMTALFVGSIFEHGLLGAKQGDPVVYDLRSSRVVAETVRSHGSEPVRCRVGHAFMKARMREQNAPFGGELSGHYYFRFPSGYVADDAAAAFMLMLETLDRSRRPLSELWRPFQVYSQSGELNRRVSDLPGTLARVRGAFLEGEADELDGLTVQFEDWWFNLRPSNTEPLLRLNVEAPSEPEMLERRDQLLSLIEG
ncbi:MAG: phosphomannomutase/phosphoglucomutase [Myxococcales bacterium]|nr:phosphomannomutase/phosphoglucomutase [Myxococcales bacterium]